jgi:hypothetical protein
MDVLIIVIIVLIALLDTSNAEHNALKLVIPINSLIQPPEHASPAAQLAKLALLNNSVLLALILKPFQLMEYVMTAHIHATLVDQDLQSAYHVLVDSVWLDLPALLLAQLELHQSTEFVNAKLVPFTLDNV